MSTYRHYVLQPRLTPTRRAWLEQLLNGPAKRARGRRTGFDCMRLGWTEWTQPFDDTERITEAGRKALWEANQA